MSQAVEQIFDLQQVVVRLRQLCPQLRQVGTAADLDAAIEHGPRARPAAFVIPLLERPSYQARTSVHMERVVLSFAVVLCVSNKADATGEAALADLQALRTGLLNALCGWVPDAATGQPVKRAGARLLRFADALLWWSDELNYEFWSRA